MRVRRAYFRLLFHARNVLTVADSQEWCDTTWKRMLVKETEFRTRGRSYHQPSVPSKKIINEYILTY